MASPVSETRGRAPLAGGGLRPGGRRDPGAACAAGWRRRRSSTRSSSIGGTCPRPRAGDVGTTAAAQSYFATELPTVRDVVPRAPRWPGSAPGPLRTQLRMAGSGLRRIDRRRLPCPALAKRCYPGRYDIRQSSKRKAGTRNPTGLNEPLPSVRPQARLLSGCGLRGAARGALQLRGTATGPASGAYAITGVATTATRPPAGSGRSAGGVLSVGSCAHGLALPSDRHQVRDWIVS